MAIKSRSIPLEAAQLFLSANSMRKLSREYYWELAVFCMDYRSGQWSRGYRILSRLNIRNFSESLCKELRKSEAYAWLVANYSKTV